MLAKNKLHILVIPSWYPNNANDLSGSFFREQSIALHNLGNEIGVLHIQIHSARNLKNLLKFNSIITKNDSGIEILKLGFPNLLFWSRKLNRLFLRKICLYLYKKYISLYGTPDIIYAHCINNAGFIAEAVSRKNNVPYVINEHSSSFLTDIYKPFYHEFKDVVNNASKCLAVSSSFKNKLNKTLKFNNCWEVHHNIVNDIFFQKSIHKKEIRDFKFIAVGNLVKIKNFSLIIDAFKSFNSIYPNSFLKIVGEGPLEKVLQKEVLEKKLGKSIKFLGKKSRHELAEEFNSSNVLIHGSYFETFGLVVCEAMAMGLPTISTITDGSKEIISPQFGVLVNQNDPSDMLKAMLHVHNNYRKYNPYSIRNYIYEKFSSDIQSKKFISYCNEVLKK